MTVFGGKLIPEPSESIHFFKKLAFFVLLALVCCDPCLKFDLLIVQLPPSRVVEKRVWIDRAQRSNWYRSLCGCGVQHAEADNDRSAELYHAGLWRAISQSMTKFVLPDEESEGVHVRLARGILGTSRTGGTVSEARVMALSRGSAGTVAVLSGRPRLRAHRSHGHAPCFSITTPGTDPLYAWSVSVRSEVDCSIMNCDMWTVIICTL